MSKPVIGIIASLVGNDADLLPSCKGVRVTNAYVLSVLGSGGVPMIIPPVDDDAAVAEMIARTDGLLISGGNDLSPLIYGEEPCKKQGSFSPERDHIDLTAIAEAHRQQKPMLGICRGIQALNVYFGGTLYQDLAQEDKFTVKHYQEGRFSAPSHTVKIEKDCTLFPILGEKIVVNSFHHQAVKDVAEGFRVGAYSKDGVIEEIEMEKGPFVMGIQWHPEVMTADGDPEMKKIFGLFVEQCSK